MGKPIKCTISGLELCLDEGIATMHYVGRTENGIALIGIPIGVEEPDLGEIPQALVFKSIREASELLRYIENILKEQIPKPNINLDINKLDAKNSSRNNRISLANKTRSI